MARMKWTSKIAAMSIAFLLSGCTKSAADSTEQQRAASTLFDQYETVFYAKSDLLTGSGGYKQLSQQDANTLRAPFAYLLQGLDVLGKSASHEILSSTSAALVGAKDFHPPQGPTGFGDVQSQFCYVLILRPGTTFEISKVAGGASSVSSVEASTWKWSAKGTEGHPEPHIFFATQVGHLYLLISNRLDEAQAISAKLGSDTAPSLSGFRDWESISRHEVWGYRRYRHTEESKEAAGTSQLTPDTQALAFFADPKQKTGVLRLFSPTGGTAQKMNETRLLPPFKVADSGVWETVIPLTGNQKSSDQIFVVMSWFGFGVSV
jgi:hypothetical protein